jgi:lipopolysaccharide transport system ATP-binding protein
MSNKAIVVENISKKYIIGSHKSASLREEISNKIKALVSNKADNTEQEFWALNGVSFSVEKGEVIGIIGKNGAGKSTLLKILSRITEPTNGRIEINGRVSSLLEVGTGFHPELSGRDNIFLNGAILGMTKREISKKFDEIVDFSGINKFIDTPVKRYSSGMYVRLAFAVAAHLEPEILIVDEVLAVGDAEFQKKCLGKLKDVSSHGRTVLFVSHNMLALKGLCDRAVLLRNGTVADIGPTDQVINQYLTGYGNKEWNKNWLQENRPGNEFIKINSISINHVNVKDDYSMISVDDELEVNVEYELLVDNIIFNVAPHLYTASGECVFGLNGPVDKFSKGQYLTKLNIPTNFLNDGVFYIKFMFVKDQSVSFFTLDDVIEFEVKETKREGRWFGKWPGVIRPTFLKFEQKKL